MAQTSLPVESTHNSRSAALGAVATGSCELENPRMAPDAVVVLSHISTVKLSGLLYSVVVSAHPVEPSVVIAWLPSGPAAWYVTP
jgi:hypothetical protein